MTLIRSGTDLISFFLFLLGQPLQKSQRFCRHKSDRDEIRQERFSTKYTLTDRVGYSIWHHSFKMAAIASFHIENWCHQVCEHKASGSIPPVPHLWYLFVLVYQLTIVFCFSSDSFTALAVIICKHSLRYCLYPSSFLTTYPTSEISISKHDLSICACIAELYQEHIFILKTITN